MNEFQRIARAIDNGEPVVEAIRRGASASSGGFDSGTLMVFQQTAAPTGWTKETTHDDKSFRVVTGTAGSGGTKAFTTTFGSGKTSDSHTLTITEMPAHNHTVGRGGFSGSANALASAIAQTLDQNITTGNKGGGTGHTHPLTNFDINYVDLIIAKKD